MQHDFSLVFETDNEYWQRVLDIFAKSESYPKKVVSKRNLHHKFPRSFSKLLGEPVDNDKDNLISLSLADHFLVHYYYYLLAKKGYRQSMATAFTFMAKKCLKYVTPETAEAMAQDYAEARVIVEQHVAEMNKNRIWSKESKEKISKLHSGKKVSDETREKIRKATIGHVVSAETRRKISENPNCHTAAFTGHKHSDASKEKISKSGKGLRWWTNGISNIRSRECPEGYYKGRTIK